MPPWQVQLQTQSLYSVIVPVFSWSIAEDFVWQKTKMFKFHILSNLPTHPACGLSAIFSEIAGFDKVCNWSPAGRDSQHTWKAKNPTSLRCWGMSVLLPQTHRNISDSIFCILVDMMSLVSLLKIIYDVWCPLLGLSRFHHTQSYTIRAHITQSYLSVCTTLQYARLPNTNSSYQGTMKIASELNMCVCGALRVVHATSRVGRHRSLQPLETSLLPNCVWRKFHIVSLSLLQLFNPSGMVSSWHLSAPLCLWTPSSFLLHPVSVILEVNLVQLTVWLILSSFNTFTFSYY